MDGGASIDTKKNLCASLELGWMTGLLGYSKEEFCCPIILGCIITTRL